MHVASPRLFGRRTGACAPGTMPVLEGTKGGTTRQGRSAGVDSAGNKKGTSTSTSRREATSSRPRREKPTKADPASYLASPRRASPCPPLLSSPRIDRQKTYPPTRVFGNLYDMALQVICAARGLAADGKKPRCTPPCTTILVLCIVCTTVVGGDHWSPLSDPQRYGPVPCHSAPSVFGGHLRATTALNVGAKRRQRGTRRQPTTRHAHRAVAVAHPSNWQPSQGSRTVLEAFSMLAGQPQEFGLASGGRSEATPPKMSLSKDGPSRPREA